MLTLDHMRYIQDAIGHGCTVGVSWSPGGLIIESHYSLGSKMYSYTDLYNDAWLAHAIASGFKFYIERAVSYIDTTYSTNEGDT